MIRFNNDYNRGAHPAILEALARTNTFSYGGYGQDEWCERASAAIRAELDGVDADVHFLVGGTQVNYTVTAAALRPYESVISADTAHIQVHETGAIENSGHKIETVPNVDGKLTAAQVQALAEAYRTSAIPEHITEPKFVFLSFPSEYGTIYSLAELKALRAVCDEYGLYLYVDGARMAYGLGAADNDVTLADLAALTDAFTIGGTKCGALFGEALVLKNPALRRHFRSYMKQNGALLAKGWLLGLQFATLFEGGRYFELGRRADALAMRLKAACEAKGLPLYMPNSTNQQFIVVTESQKATLAKDFIFEGEGTLPDGREIVRFCTSWASTDEELDTLCRAIAAL